jgi:hypothetical protein
MDQNANWTRVKSTSSAWRVTFPGDVVAGVTPPPEKLVCEKLVLMRMFLFRY